MTPMRNQIIADLARAKAENEKLRGLVDLAANIFTHCTVTDGVCCCGDNMDGHPDPMGCGHTPVDHGSYVVDKWCKEHASLTKGSPPADDKDATIARLSQQVNTLTTEKHADAEAIGALEAKLVEVTAERDAARDDGFAQGIEAACKVIDAYEEYDQQLCCDGQMCGCQGARVHEAMQHYIRALSPTQQADPVREAVNETWLKAIGMVAEVRNNQKPGATFATINLLVGEMDEERRRALSPTPQADVECQRCGSVGGFGCYECTPQADPVREAARVLETALGRAQIDSSILRLFYAGKPAAALRALAQKGE